MPYTVNFTEYASKQLSDTVSYISNVLLSPDSAARWLDKLNSRISELKNLPYRFPLVNEDLWKKRCVRKMPVENFIVYYWINDNEKTVWILAVIYGHRDQLTELRSIPL